MRFIIRQIRDQIILFPVSLDRSIDPDNEVRIIDLFVESLSLKDYGFRTDFTENGRQAIVEHPYGTIKRQWGFSYILTKKGISSASSDVGFMFIAYNLRRIGSILTRERLKEYLRILVLAFLHKICLAWLQYINFKTLSPRFTVATNKFRGSLITSCLN